MTAPGSSDVDARIERARLRWGLTLDDRPAYGEWNVVRMAHRGDLPCVLRICGDGHDSDGEIAALRTWNGTGAVRLLEADSGERALLLERLHADHSLADIDILDAAEIAGGLIRTLAVPAPSGLPLLTDVAREIVAELPDQQAVVGYPIPVEWLDRAVSLAGDLSSDPGESLVHGDLHYGNVLVGNRQPWLAIDPKPFIGNPERSVAELMWTRIDDMPDDDAIRSVFDTIVQAGRLNPERAHAWVVVRAASYWLWGLANGLTIDPVRCERLLGALVS